MNVDRIADTIADRLLTDGSGTKGVRLAIKLMDQSDGVKTEREGGGWGRASIIRVVQEVILESQRKSEWLG